MKYIALLRGINVGKNRRVGMEKIRAVFELSGCVNVSTYINSGNVIFESALPKDAVGRRLEKALSDGFGFEIPLLVKTKKEMQNIAKAIPAAWQNDAKQRTDVAYLFRNIDSKMILDKLPIKREFVSLCYVKGAVIWNTDRKNLNKSRLNKLIGSELYRSMTIRNVNTARFLAGG
jgi:uncharacterized protein (DUF1697 family)